MTPLFTVLPLNYFMRQSLHLHRENCPFLSLCFSSLCVASMLYDFLEANPKTVSCLSFFTFLTFLRFVFYVLWHFCFVTFTVFNVLQKVTFMFLTFYVQWRLTFSKILFYVRWSLHFGTAIIRTIPSYVKGAVVWEPCRSLLTPKDIEWSLSWQIFDQTKNSLDLNFLHRSDRMSKKLELQYNTRTTYMYIVYISKVLPSLEQNSNTVKRTVLRVQPLKMVAQGAWGLGWARFA